MNIIKKIFRKIRNSACGRIERASSAVILVDMQEGFVSNLRKGEGKRILPKQLAVLKYCNDFGIPVIVLELDVRRFGSTVDILMRQIRKNSKFFLIEKEMNSGFYKTSLDSLLKRLGIKNLLIMGINADYCVMETSKDAIERGYNIITSNELISGQDHHSRNNSVPWFKDNGIYVDSINDLVGIAQ